METEEQKRDLPKNSNKFEAGQSVLYTPPYAIGLLKYPAKVIRAYTTLGKPHKWTYIIASTDADKRPPFGWPQQVDEEELEADK